MKTMAKALIVSLAALAAACSDSGTGSTVPETVAMVQVAAPASAVDVGATLQLTATPFSAAGKPLPGKLVAWSSSDESVATVSQAGQVATLAPGTVVITATSGSRGGSFTLVVRPQQQADEVARVEISGPSPVVLAPGAARQLTATPRSANGAALGGHAVAWASSNPAVATVSATGQVTAVSSGVAMVSATSEGKTAQMPVVVSQEDVAAVEVTPNTAIVVAGQALQLVAKPKSATNVILDRVVTWASGNEAVATVDGTGKVTALAAGTVRITASVDGRQGFADLRVTTVAGGF